MMTATTNPISFFEMRKQPGECDTGLGLLPAFGVGQGYAIRMQITNRMEYNKTNTQLFTLLVMGLIKRRFKQRTFVEGNNYKAGIMLVRLDSAWHVAVEIPSTRL